MSSIILGKGDVVNIYSSPLEFEGWRGKAKLLERMDDLPDDSPLQLWIVQFVVTNQIDTVKVWFGTKIEELTDYAR